MPLETLKNCPVCNKSGFSNYLNVEDYTVSHQEFTIQQCNSCYFLLTNPRPDQASIGEYYQSQDYISHHDEAKTLMSKVYNLVRNHTIDEKVRLLNKLVPSKGSLLDVGCGTGNFIQAARNDGWHVSGVEPDSQARSVAGNRVGETIYETIQDPAISKDRYNIITLWHVLEHVHALNETIIWLHEHLLPNGKIIVAVPNSQSLDAAAFGRYWAAYDVPRHLYHFTKNDITHIMDNHGLKVKRVLPMWFDAFYVGLLSTKYKLGKSNLPRSLFTGIKSNIKGSSSDNAQINTSSLIYIITKK